MSSKFNDDRFLARWLNNELTPEELSEFQNSDDYAVYKKIIAGSENIESPAFDDQALLSRIRSQQSGKLIVTKRKINYLRYAAAAVLLLATSFVFYTMLVPDMTTIQTQIGEQRTISLPDGSEVVLNANSSLTYSEDDWEENTRTVKLVGEAFFKVQKGNTFTVHSNTGSVSVLGTQFTVRDVADFYEVKCFEGSVEVASGEEKEILKPKRSVRRLGNKRMLLRSIKGSSPEWLIGKTTFESVPVSQVLAALKNQYDIRIESGSLDQGLIYSGTFPHDDLELAVKVVFTSLDIDYELKDGNVVVVAAK
ncbi:FecR domain-containing protein [Ekhidna sp. MALMAid0563]|uniref:FecR family protein n=1 Tax=Ekhidna sp. MALMAid0563 TaxID=3143937 RepID=UPI0032E050C3